MTDPSAEPATFTPAEAAEITGLSQAMQKDWRRRGLLRSFGGKNAKWTLMDIADMLIMRRLSEAGVSPKVLRKAALKAGASVIQRVIASLSLRARNSTEYNTVDTPRYLVVQGDLMMRSHTLEMPIQGFEAADCISIVVDCEAAAQIIVSRLRDEFVLLPEAGQ